MCVFSCMFLCICVFVSCMREHVCVCVCVCVCVFCVCVLCVCVCVCEAIVQPFRHETAYIVFATGQMFRDVYAMFQAFSLFVYVLVSLATGLMPLMWHNSKECLIALVVWIMLRSQT